MRLPSWTLGLNLLYLMPGETGGSEVYARQLVPAIAQVRPDVRLVAFAAGELADELAEAPWAPALEVVRLPVSGRSRVRRTAVEHTALPVVVRRAGVTLLHSLNATAPVVAGCTQVVTIFDLIHRTHPETHAGLLSTGLRVLVPLAARSADRIITLSLAARDDLVRLLGVPAGKVDVIPAGPGTSVPLTATPPDVLRVRLGIDGAPVVLSVSARRPHKNLERLIDAMARVEGDARPVLVLPGYPSRLDDELRRRAEAAGVGERVRLCGWVSDNDLEGLYRLADCLVFPSLAEGFGLPVLEAMRRGVPVACSDTSSLPEVAGDAALLFDPRSTDAIAAAMTALLGDGDLRRRLAERGRERARRYSWEAAATATLASYDRALAGTRGPSRRSQYMV